MKNWARRIRGAIGMGLAWAAGWMVAGGILARFPGFDGDLPLPLFFAPLGFLTGFLFSGVLVAIERRRGLQGASLTRFAGWGAASGLLLSGLFGVGALLRGANFFAELLFFGPALTTAGAVCAAGSLALARRAQMRELSSGTDDLETLGLSDEEKLKLLGD